MKTKKKSNKHMRINIILTFLLFFSLFNSTFAENFSNLNVKIHNINVEIQIHYPLNHDGTVDVIENVEIHYKLNHDGTVDVIEKINYSFFGCDFCFDLYTYPSTVKIRNASGYCVNANCSFFTRNYEDRFVLVLRNEEVIKEGFYIAVFNYTIDEEILEQKDVAQFFYKVWHGQGYISSSENKTYIAFPGKINIYITFPGDVDEIKYFIHQPEDSYINVNKIDRNTLHIKSVSHLDYQHIEINALMPKKWFTKLKKADRYMSAEEIIRGEEFSMLIRNIRKAILLIMIFFLLSPIVVAAFIYLKYGKDEPFDINAIPPYIRDISEIGKLSPTEATLLLNPSTVITLSTGYFYKIVPSAGPFYNIITAELLELYRLGYLDIVEKEITDTSAIFNKKRKVIALKPIEGKDLSKLTEIQRSLYEFIINNSKNGSFSFEEFSMDKNAKIYINQIFEKLEEKISEMPEEKYIDKTGIEKLRRFAVFYIFILFNLFVSDFVVLILSPFLFLLGFLDQKSILTLLPVKYGICSFFLIVLALIILLFMITYRPFLGKHRWIFESKLTKKDIESSVFYFFISFISILILKVLDLLPTSDIKLLFFVAFLSVFISYIILKDKAFLGKWTSEGRLIHEKLKRYKKFMEDLRLMEKEEVGRVILWEELLIYATAFGVANEVIEALKVHYPDYQKDRVIKNLSSAAIFLRNSMIDAMERIDSRYYRIRL